MPLSAADGASSAEFQDLMSEYNLLKDVNHPNVIRLLGASTQGGGSSFSDKLTLILLL